MENPNDAKPEDDSEVSSAAAEDSGSLQDWINRAKRAHELIDAVDLKKAANHDAAEMAKIDAISEAFKDLEEGRDVSHVAGVDDVVRQTDERSQAKTALIELLDKLGWADRLNRVLFRRDDSGELKPIELIPHFEGLPDFEVCLAPTDATSVGYFGLFITTSGLFAATIQDPPGKHHWNITQSRPYDDQTELISSLRQFSESAFD